jgi:hypothetical protein
MKSFSFSKLLIIVLAVGAVIALTGTVSAASKAPGWHYSNGINAVVQGATDVGQGLGGGTWFTVPAGGTAWVAVPFETWGKETIGKIWFKVNTETGLVVDRIGVFNGNSVDASSLVQYISGSWQGTPAEYVVSLGGNKVISRGFGLEFRVTNTDATNPHSMYFQGAGYRAY